MLLEIRPTVPNGAGLNAELLIDHCFECYVQLPAHFPPGTYPLELKQDIADGAYVLALVGVPQFPRAALSARPAPQALLLGRNLRQGQLGQGTEALQRLLRITRTYVLSGGLSITVHAPSARITVLRQVWPLPENPLCEPAEEAPVEVANPGPLATYHPWLDRHAQQLWAAEMFMLCEIFVWAWHVLTNFLWRNWLEDAIICALFFGLGYLSGQNDQN